MASDDARAAPTESWALLGLVVASRAYLALFLGLGLWAALPLLLGWQSTVVSSGSMSPRLPVGSVLVSSTVDPADLVRGNVVLYAEPGRPGRLTSHRVLRLDPAGAVLTRGDANAQDDSSPVQVRDVRGLGRLLVPYVGRPVLWLRTGAWLPLTAWALVTAGAMAVVLRRPTSRTPDAYEDGDRPGGSRRPLVAATGSVALVLLLTVCLSPQGALVLSAAAFTGTTANPGSTYATDVLDNWPRTNYAAAVLADGPGTFWQLDEPATATAVTAANDGGAGVAGVATYSATGVTRGITPDATPREGGSAVTLDGAAGCIRGTQLLTNPQTYTVELWFRTSTTRGGKLIGFGNNGTSTPSTSYDRHLYMTNDGRLVFGTYPSAVKVATSTASYNKGAWHLATASSGPGGMFLYVDGVQVATNTNTVSQVYNGYWRVGCDNLNGWPDIPLSQFFAGDVDNVAVYPTQLSAARVAAHYGAV